LEASVPAFCVTITEKGGPSSDREFDQPEVTIGRVQGNDIVLPKSNISKRHARIINNNGSFVIIDSKSTNGTYINGKRIDEPYDLRDGDKIFVGDFTLEVLGDQDSQDDFDSDVRPTKPPPPPRGTDDDVLPDDDWDASSDALDDDWEDDWDGESAEISEASAPVPERRDSHTRQSRPRDRGEVSKSSASKSSASKRSGPKSMGGDKSVALRRVHERLLKTLDLRTMDVEHMDDTELRSRTRDAVEQIVKDMDSEGGLPKAVKPQALIDSVLDEALGLGPLEDFLHDESVTEIMVNSAKQIFVERKGRLELTERVFSSDQAVLGVIERIVAPLGRRIDESSPMVDARLKDGSRVNAIIPPLAIRGPTLTIRKFTAEPLTIADLVGSDTLTANVAEFLETCVKARQNILISGGTGSGKTTTLNALSGYIPESERIVTIEDAAELKLDQAHVVSLETRPPNIEGRGSIDMRDLVRNALRMRPDRIVVGECRGGEALDMLQAMNTGHDGSLTTVHANGPRDALGRLETMVMMAGMEFPMRAIRDQIASAVNIIVQQTRFPDGSRRITHVSEVTGMEGDVITMQDVFVFEQKGFGDDGRVAGEHTPTGAIPRFFESLNALGITPNFKIFQD